MSDVVSRTPDRGWSWVILMACTLTCMLTGFAYGSFNVFYVALVEHFDSERGTTGWIGSLFGFSGNILGFIIGTLDKKFGSKSLALVGSVVTSGAILLSSLLVSIPYLYITYGIIGGIGYTFVVLPTLVILPKYFERRRPLAIGLATSGFSVGALISAPVVNIFLQEYGLSGAYILTAGIWLNNAVGASLFRSVEFNNRLYRHYEGTCSTKELSDQAPTSNTSRTDVTHSIEHRHKDNRYYTQVPAAQGGTDVVTDGSGRCDDEQSTVSDYSQPHTSDRLEVHIEEVEILTNGHDTMNYAHEKECVTEKTDVEHVEPKSKCYPPLRAFCAELMDFTVLRNIQFDFFLFGIFAINLGFAAFYMHYLSRILYLGIERNQAILLQSTMGICLGIGRCGISFVANMQCVQREVMFGVLIIIMALIEITFPMARVFTPLMIYGILHGLVGGAIMSQQTVVLVDVGGTEQISKITGFFTMTAAMGLLLAIPLAGFLFDVSQNYDLPFYVAGSVTCVGGLESLALAVYRKHWRSPAKS